MYMYMYIYIYMYMGPFFGLAKKVLCDFAKIISWNRPRGNPGQALGLRGKFLQNHILFLEPAPGSKKSGDSFKIMFYLAPAVAILGMLA